MKVLFCSSEVVPFAKTGGLADVAGTLPLALQDAGAEVKVIMPRYRMIDIKKCKLKKVSEDIYTAKLGEKVDIYFIDNKDYFDREGLYQYRGVDFADNLDRFTFFCRKTLDFTKKIKFKPDIIHCHDWQTALINVYLKTSYKNDKFFKKTKTVFTIHNLGYQGLFPAQQLSLTGLPESILNIEGIEFYGKVNLLKGGLMYSDKITTVSPTYAQEIQTKEFGYGLEGVLQKRKNDVVGILNGIDYTDWDPIKNTCLAKNYSLETLDDKRENKLDLQKLGNLSTNRDVPLFGMITRLVDQKGIDIFTKVVDRILKLPLQFVLLGTGDAKYHIIFENIRRQYKNALIYLKFDPVLAYKIYAGSDVFLMPSHYEPCGLGQLISLAYGTVPLVRRTGGLADTVTDFDTFTQSGNGFVFDDYQSGSLLETVKRALCVYQNKNCWRKLMENGIRGKFSWEESAKKYINLYKELSAKKK